MIINDYLYFLQEQQFGVQPKRPVQNPRGKYRKSMKRLQPKTPKARDNPSAPRMPSPAERQAQEDAVMQSSRLNKGQYFNYMVWAAKLSKQGEIFKRNCYEDNCAEMGVGSGERRLCKDRCDIEAYKKIIQMLQISINRCANSATPDQCRIRFKQLIPVYQEKLNALSKKFINSERIQSRTNNMMG